MNTALFGGTFDPIHNGHIAVAAAAADRFHLGRVLFAPAALPPLKERLPVTPFAHRYAMMCLATAHDRRFIPSLADFNPSGQTEPNYSLHTVRRITRFLKKTDRLFFLVGIDAFLHIRRWYKSEELLAACEFIVASRPGFSLRDLAGVLPDKLRREVRDSAWTRRSGASTLTVGKARIHLLDDVWSRVSSTQIRTLVSGTKPATRYLDPAVAAYIKKVGLYSKRSARDRARIYNAKH